ncbi:MAG: hypothetical protein ACREH4_09415, partial [Vitreimonas sp.]
RDWGVGIGVLGIGVCSAGCLEGALERKRFPNPQSLIPSPEFLMRADIVTLSEQISSAVALLRRRL